MQTLVMTIMQTLNLKHERMTVYIADPELQTELRWKKYLTCLEQGAWGDNIAMQAISDMLNVTINVLSSNSQKPLC